MPTFDSVLQVVAISHALCVGIAAHTRLPTFFLFFTLIEKNDRRGANRFFVRESPFHPPHTPRFISIPRARALSPYFFARVCVCETTKQKKKSKIRKHVIVEWFLYSHFVHYTTVSDLRLTKDFIVPDAF